MANPLNTTHIEDFLYHLNRIKQYTAIEVATNDPEYCECITTTYPDHKFDSTIFFIPVDESEIYWLTIDGKTLFYFWPSSPANIYKFNLAAELRCC
jgi:hypothetical protein